MNTFIVSASRTPIGSFSGCLASLSGSELGAHAIKASLEHAAHQQKLELETLKTQIDEVYMGEVLTAGVGQAPARQAAIKAGLSIHTPCTTVGKVCGSGMKALMLADLQIRAGDAHCVVAGGMESMSNAPFLVPKMRAGLRLGHGELLDSMIKDGLWDVYNDFHMGNATELCVKKFNLSREAQDAYAVQSYKRAQQAIQSGRFKNEISPIKLKSKKGSQLIEQDEEPFRFDEAKFSSLRPAFDKEGTVTAGNASTINDGASALLLCSENFVNTHKLKPLARIVAQASGAEAPEWFTTAPSRSIHALLKKAGKTVSDIDLWEINEAFAAVALANMQLLEINPAQVNIYGGAVALGHPIGCSGARIVTTLVHALGQENKRWGAASLCIGGGEATSLLIERL